MFGTATSKLHTHAAQKHSGVIDLLTANILEPVEFVEHTWRIKKNVLRTESNARVSATTPFGVDSRAAPSYAMHG